MKVRGHKSIMNRRRTEGGGGTSDEEEELFAFNETPRHLGTSDSL